MKRKEAVNIPGGTFHVMNRGNRQQRIFEDECDREVCKRILGEVSTEYSVDVLAETQMFTHFHAVVTTPRGNLSDFMERWEGRYAQYFNVRHRRAGHLFEGPFRCVIVEHDVHLFIATAYVFNNPVKSGLVSAPEGWKWSSYAANVGLVPAPEYISNAWLETLFSTSSLHEAQALLRQCMNAPHPVLTYLDVAAIDCDQVFRSYIADRLEAMEQPCSYRTLSRPPLDVLFPTGLERLAVVERIRVAHEAHGYKLNEIAPYVGLQPANVSRLYRGNRRRNSRRGQSTSRRIEPTPGLLQSDRPTDADLELRHEPATADAELSKEAIIVLEPKKITPAGVDLARSAIEIGELGNGNDRSSTLNQRPSARAKLKLGDEVNVDGPKPQSVTKAAVDPRS